MNNQFSKSNLDISIQRVAVQALAFLLAIVLAILGVTHLRMSDDPYIQQVLSIDGDPQQGQAIFLMNCAGCHGSLADGHVGPSLRGISERKSPSSLIEQVTSGKTPPMPQFQPSPEIMADLLKYLETL
ncbi:MAG: cytochrome c [Cyanobacteriota bacterium]|nr:cytochrome c [Cyanobacteriota bacterium]